MFVNDLFFFKKTLDKLPNAEKEKMIEKYIVTVVIGLILTVVSMLIF